jgi:DNA-binding transcriptional ArsR family regulator
LKSFIFSIYSSTFLNFSVILLNVLSSRRLAQKVKASLNYQETVSMEELELSAAQMKCLASPMCNAVVQALRALGQASAAELAKSIGRSPATVHYHLRSLLECSLVREAGRRPTARKPEAVFELAAPRLKFPKVEPDSAEGELARRAVAAGLRQVIRGYEKAATDQTGKEGMLHVLRAQIRLKRADAERFLEMLEAASRFAEENRTEQGTLLHWSSVVYPDA